MLLRINVVFARLHIFRIHNHTLLELIHSLLPILHVYRDNALREVIVKLVFRSGNRLGHPFKVIYRKTVLHRILKRITPVAVQRVCRIVKQRQCIDGILGKRSIVVHHRLIEVSIGKSPVTLTVIPTI